MSNCDPDTAVPPGVTLLEMIIEDFCDRIDLSQDCVEDVIAGRKVITSEIAEILAAHFEMTERFWLNLQRNYDEWRKRHEASIGDPQGS